MVVDLKFVFQVREFFERRIAHQYPEPEPNQDPYLAVQERHESFMKSRAGSVIGREKICKEVCVL